MSSFFCKKKRGVQIVHLSWKALGHQFVNLMTLGLSPFFFNKISTLVLLGNLDLALLIHTSLHYEVRDRIDEFPYLLVCR